MLELHLGRCAQCREYAADVTRFTDELRSAPLEILARPAFVERGRRGMALPGCREELLPLPRDRGDRGRAGHVVGAERRPAATVSRQSRSSRRRRSSIASLPSSRACPRAAPPPLEARLSRPPILAPMPRLIVCALFAMLVLVVAACGGADAEPTDAEYARAVVTAVDRTDYALARVTRAKSMDELVKRMSEAGVVISAAGERARGARCSERVLGREREARQGARDARERRVVDSGAASAAGLRGSPHGRARSQLRQLGRSQPGARQSHRVRTSRPDPAAALALPAQERNPRARIPVLRNP